MLNYYFTEQVTRIRMRNRKLFPGKETLARRIRDRREDLQLQQGDVVRLLKDNYNVEISQPAYSKYETGETATPSLPVLSALSKVLDISLDYLINGVEWQPAAIPFLNREANTVAELIDEIEDEADRRLLLSLVESISRRSAQYSALERDMLDLLEETIINMTEVQRAKAQSILQKISRKYDIAN